ncbi:uncharacterized protein SPSK_05771 [Sporothrix schenckii 1099-18]|uniref:Uncharacterized protein n=1 Tax=Sporothrix schenckii 1099-18 TaxID=1397361 RepID=A0A0F2LWE3_SPOSC|nr:uncharacterized protein SPSK_05771 [Sporothrix schenckii 1099-18]KJR80815.1 hypothetical protein SPSK_05771 [Sporothrix schenckii 1099-18]
MSRLLHGQNDITKGEGLKIKRGYHTAFDFATTVYVLYHFGQSRPVSSMSAGTRSHSGSFAGMLVLNTQNLRY